MPHESEAWTVFCGTVRDVISVTNVCACNCVNCGCICQALERILRTSYISVSFVKVVLSAVVDQLQALCMYITTFFDTF